jgi:hypothetical protein
MASQPTSARTSVASLCTNHLARGDARRDAGLRRAGQDGQDGAEPLGAPAPADARRAGVVRRRLVQAVADEPADRQVRLGRAHRPPVVHDPERQSREHRPRRDLGVDAGPPRRGAVQRLDLGAQPAEVQGAIHPGQDVVVWNQPAQRSGHG